jgi:hypothetical protein
MRQLEKMLGQRGLTEAKIWLQQAASTGHWPRRKAKVKRWRENSITMVTWKGLSRVTEENFKASDVSCWCNAKNAERGGIRTHGTVTRTTFSSSKILVLACAVL